MPQMEVLKQDSVSISTINAGTGNKEAGITVFELTILSIMEFYSVEWSEFQVREVAEMLYADCYWFSLAELKHFALRVKKADFKPLEDYSKFAPKHIMQCATIYANDCLVARGQFNFLKHQEKPEDPNVKYVDPEVVSAGLKDFVSKLTSEINEERENEEDSARLKEERRKWIEEQGDNLNWAEFQKQFGKNKRA